MPTEAPALVSPAGRPGPGTAPLPLSDWRDYVALLKPRVMSLVVFTAACGLLLAPRALPPFLAGVAILAIAVGAGAAGAFNQWLEADLDRCMARTRNRPLPSGRLARENALAFAVLLAVFSVTVMAFAANLLAAGLLAASIVFYAVIYTLWLKPRTPQNIVIGGAAGAFPPVIGWAAASGDLGLLPALLFLIIFLWTPPHFWSLALFLNGDYGRAGIPMLPVTHGPRHTRRQILLYSVALALVSLAPVPTGLAGPLYGAAALGLAALFLWFAIRVSKNAATDPCQMQPEKRLFAFSILYLFLLFAALVADSLVAAA